VALDWALHLPFALGILALVQAAPLSIWAYLLACYAAMSVLKIRTFLEHRAHDHTSARTVIIEGQCPLSFLFLNNSFHLVHHMYPEVAWYRLPALYAQQRDRFLQRNQGYVYRSYGQIIRQFMFARKEPVAHPLWKAGGN
jgi:fatty acid desaturase